MPVPRPVSAPLRRAPTNAAGRAAPGYNECLLFSLPGDFHGAPQGRRFFVHRCLPELRTGTGTRSCRWRSRHASAGLRRADSGCLSAQPHNHCADHGYPCSRGNTRCGRPRGQYTGADIQYAVARHQLHLRRGLHTGTGYPYHRARCHHAGNRHRCRHPRDQYTDANLEYARARYHHAGADISRRAIEIAGEHARSAGAQAAARRAHAPPPIQRGRLRQPTERKGAIRPRAHTSRTSTQNHGQ